HRADGVEAAQVVLAWGIVAVPGDHIERRMIEPRRPQLAAEFGDELDVSGAILVPGDWSLKVAWIGEPVRADGAEVGQAHRRAEAFADVASRLTVRELDPEAQTARNQQHLLRHDLQDPELGRDAQPPELRHD